MAKFSLGKMLVGDIETSGTPPVNPYPYEMGLVPIDTDTNQIHTSSHLILHIKCPTFEDMEREARVDPFFYKSEMVGEFIRAKVMDGVDLVRAKSEAENKFGSSEGGLDEEARKDPLAYRHPKMIEAIEISAQKGLTIDQCKAEIEKYIRDNPALIPPRPVVLTKNGSALDWPIIHDFFGPEWREKTFHHQPMDELPLVRAMAHVGMIHTHSQKKLEKDWLDGVSPHASIADALATGKIFLMLLDRLRQAHENSPAYNEAKAKKIFMV